MCESNINFEVNDLDWDKGEGLLPAIIQDSLTKNILMLGYMNKESLKLTLETKKVTFFSRSKQSLWVKGETSGNYLDYISARIDCDKDTILIQVKPHGPVCHTGDLTCFENINEPSYGFLSQLEKIIQHRFDHLDEGSYTSSLFKEGTSRMAQKVGEEGVEVSLAAVKKDTEELKSEASDLIFHLLVLLKDQGLQFSDIIAVLEQRHSK
ncbi:MAG: bifunctional phosphoribosyl-AMP cyclohydrolase/phosphoribosyl-ATP diphosphatase HisIE [Pseudomonadota bacterium]